MLQIAIDGPSGAGKSTVAKILAAKLKIVYVDTGALYRTIGYYVRSQNVAADDAKNVIALLPKITVRLTYEDGKQAVLLNGENLGEKIRTPEISMYASKVSAIPEVRKFLLNTQRDIANAESVVMDGRDIGTVILPNAQVKIFLTASNECRAQRRCEELKAKGMNVTYEEILADMTQRDKQDSQREVAPAIPAEDAVILDNSQLDPDETASAIIQIAKDKGISL